MGHFWDCKNISSPHRSTNTMKDGRHQKSRSVHTHVHTLCCLCDGFLDCRSQRVRASSFLSATPPSSKLGCLCHSPFDAVKSMATVKLICVLQESRRRHQKSQQTQSHTVENTQHRLKLLIYPKFGGKCPQSAVTQSSNRIQLILFGLIFISMGGRSRL